MNRVFIKTYGCQMNERDSEAVAAMLRGKGYSIVDQEMDADVILLNTCSVREQAEQKAIGKAGHIASRKRKNPNLIVGVMGCMAQNRGADLLDSLPEQGDFAGAVGGELFDFLDDRLNRTGAFGAAGLGNDAVAAVHIAALHDADEGRDLRSILEVRVDGVLRAVFGL